MIKLRIINTLAAAVLLVSSSAFAVSFGGGTIAPQESLTLPIPVAQLNLNSPYKIKCDVTNESEHDVNVLVYADNPESFMPILTYVNASGYRGFGALKPGSNNKLGMRGAYLGAGVKLIITNQDEHGNVTVNTCEAKMVQHYGQ